MVTRVNGSVKPTAAKDSNHHRRRCRGGRGVARVYSADGAGTGVVGGLISTFHLNSRYSGFKTIGRGSFGVVCSAWDYRQRKKVAIKKIAMAGDVVSAKHALREIRLMRYLGSHENIVSLEDLFISENHDELYIVMELLDCDLHYVINKSNQALGNAHHRYFMYQILRGVQFLHDNRIIHRDLKPGNVLVTKNCQLKITDFGLARLRPMGSGIDPDDEVEHPMTETAVTRWYRPPELMLCPDGLYGYAVDLWSVGCIFAELLGRHPFFPGENFKDQLSLIFNAVGSPKPHEVAHIRNPEAIRFLESMRDRVKVPYAGLFPKASKQAISLLDGLLVFHPPDRLSVHEALNHPYFLPLRGKVSDAPDPEIASGFEFGFESEKLDRDQLKDMILQEVESFRGEQQLRLDDEPGCDTAATTTTNTTTNTAGAPEARPSPPSAASDKTHDGNVHASDSARASASAIANANAKHNAKTNAKHNAKADAKAITKAIAKANAKDNAIANSGSLTPSGACSDGMGADRSEERHYRRHLLRQQKKRYHKRRGRRQPSDVVTMAAAAAARAASPVAPQNVDPIAARSISALATPTTREGGVDEVDGAGGAGGSGEASKAGKAGEAGEADGAARHAEKENDLLSVAEPEPTGAPAFASQVPDPSKEKPRTTLAGHRKKAPFYIKTSTSRWGLLDVAAAPLKKSGRSSGFPAEQLESVSQTSTIHERWERNSSAPDQADEA